MRDGVIIVFLTLRPLRLRNLTDLRLGVHLRRQVSGSWRIQVPGSETKNWETIDWVVPEDLARFLESYLAVDRPALLARRNGPGAETEDHLWISEDGFPLSYTTLRHGCGSTRGVPSGFRSVPIGSRCRSHDRNDRVPDELADGPALLGDRDPAPFSITMIRRTPLWRHKVDKVNGCDESRVAQQGLIP